MNSESNNILDRLPRTDGATTPEGYFEGFAARVMARLPEQAPAAAPERPTLWTRVRPYLYMAAMFGGVWLMMWVFNDIASAPSYQRMADNPAIARVLASDQVYQLYDSDVSEYDLLEELYDEGVAPAALALDNISTDICY